jgi:hypothetical protein
VADLFATRGPPAGAPGRLASVTRWPGAARVPERQAVDAVRRRRAGTDVRGVERTAPGGEPPSRRAGRGRRGAPPATRRRPSRDRSPSRGPGDHGPPAPVASRRGGRWRCRTARGQPARRGHRWGAVRGGGRWHAPREGALDLRGWVIAGDHRPVTCPAGPPRRRWTPARDHPATAVITLKGARGEGRAGPSRFRGPRPARRARPIRPRAPHEARMAQRQRPPTPACQAAQARRWGSEGTRSSGRRRWGRRRARAIGLANTPLQPWARAAVMHLARRVRWRRGAPRAPTRQTPVQQRPQAAAERSPAPSKIRQQDQMCP